MYGLEQDELLLEVWNSWICPIQRKFTSKTSQVVRGASVANLSYYRMDSPCEVQLLLTNWNYVVIACFQLWDSQANFPLISLSRLLNDSDTKNADFHLSRQFPWHSINKQLKCAFLHLLLKTRRCVFFSLMSTFPEAKSFPGPFHAIGSFADAELFESDEIKFIAKALNLSQLFLLFCICILFVILKKLWKWKLRAQQRELTWLMLNRWRRLSQSSRVCKLYISSKKHQDPFSSSAWSHLEVCCLIICSSLISKSKFSSRMNLSAANDSFVCLPRFSTNWHVFLLSHWAHEIVRHTPRSKTVFSKPCDLERSFFRSAVSLRLRRKKGRRIWTHWKKWGMTTGVKRSETVGTARKFKLRQLSFCRVSKIWRFVWCSVAWWWSVKTEQSVARLSQSSEHVEPSCRQYVGKFELSPTSYRSESTFSFTLMTVCWLGEVL